MKRWIILLCMLVWLLPASAAAEDYVLGPGDILNINVFGFPDLSVSEIAVRPDGKFAFPPVGEIPASGLTVPELTARLTEKLGFYYENPVITINITQFRTTRIYVVGQVNRPGAYELDRHHRLMDAIGAAQGWTRDAAKTKVYIIHDGQTADPQKANLMDLLKKGNSAQNCVLKEGDIVYLTENNRIDVANDVLPLIYPAHLIKNWGSPSN